MRHDAESLTPIHALKRRPGLARLMRFAGCVSAGDPHALSERRPSGEQAAGCRETARAWAWRRRSQPEGKIEN